LDKATRKKFAILLLRSVLIFISKVKNKITSISKY
jgi:hypothetical protein